MNKHTKDYILNESKKHILEVYDDIKAGEKTTQLEIYKAIRNDIDIDISKLTNIIINYEWIIEPKKSIDFYINLHYSYSEVNVVEVTEYVSSVVSYLTDTVIE